MTKTEFREQFKRLRVAGYRLPVSDGVTVDDVLAEWFKTFGGCTVGELSRAIDKLKEVKTDTFWPAPGELWAQVYEVRKAHRIQMQASNPDYGEDTPQHVREELAGMFREFAAKLSQRMAMPKVEPQVPPQHVMDDEERQYEEDRRAEDAS